MWILTVCYKVKADVHFVYRCQVTKPPSVTACVWRCAILMLTRYSTPRERNIVTLQLFLVTSPHVLLLCLFSPLENVIFYKYPWDGFVTIEDMAGKVFWHASLVNTSGYKSSASQHDSWVDTVCSHASSLHS